MSIRVEVSRIPGECVSIGCMPLGSLGEDNEGNIFYRTGESAACLTEAMCSYQSAAHVSKKVRLLPQGTVVTLTVV